VRARVVGFLLALAAVFAVSPARAVDTESAPTREEALALCGQTSRWIGMFITKWENPSCEGGGGVDGGGNQIVAKGYGDMKDGSSTHDHLINFVIPPLVCSSSAPPIVGWALLKGQSGTAVVCNEGCKYYLGGGETNSNGTDRLGEGEWFPTGGACPPGLPELGGGTGDGDGEPSAPPAVCGEGTCYDPGTDTYCYAAGGAKTCISGDAARGAGTGAGDTPTGGCVNGDGSTICAGAPPPLPAPPPATPISDPVSEINTSDRYTTGTTTGGASGEPSTSTGTTVVNVYSSGNGPTSSGQGHGDAGPNPAPSGSTGGTPGGDPDGGDKDKGKGSMAGGGNCNSPPVCSGDAPTCGVVTQTWLLRCGASIVDADGNGQPDWTQVKPGDGDGYGVEESSLGSVFKEKTVDATGLDSSGWVGSSCPFIFREANGTMFDMSQYQDFFCRWLALIHSIMLVFGAFVSLKILAGSSE
jgi:hypothetical protein